MRMSVAVMIIALTPLFLHAQEVHQQRIRSAITASQTGSVENLVKQAAEQLGNVKRVHERDMKVLRHLRAADEALADTMQRNTAVQKAFDHVDAAKDLKPDFLVNQGVIRLHQELESARRSPASADIERIRSLLRSEAIGPATRLVVRRATALQQEILDWLKAQELISSHLRELSEITSESLRASQ